MPTSDRRVNSSIGLKGGRNRLAPGNTSWHQAYLRASDRPDQIEDIYVPGIGVRAALGGDVPEPSTFWPPVRAKCERITQSVRHGLSGVSGRRQGHGLTDLERPEKPPEDAGRCCSSSCVGTGL